MDEKPETFGGGDKPLHRDDLPMDVAEQIVNLLKEAHPGTNVVFAGDAVGEKAEVAQAASKAFYDAVVKSFKDGCCFSCGKRMPGLPESEDDTAWENWQPPDGWSMVPFGPKDTDPMIIDCPECEDKSVDGVPREMTSPYFKMGDQ